MRLSDFAGTWRLTKRLHDRRAGVEGHFEGEARFTPAATGLAYEETGLLSLAGQRPLAAERRYLWREEAGRIAVDYADGRPFHEFDADNPAPLAEHLCAPDHYAVRYDFAGWPEWEAEWTVTGPRKDYLLRCRYSPSAS